jgi:hypothetical protein
MVDGFSSKTCTNSAGCLAMANRESSMHEDDDAGKKREMVPSEVTSIEFSGMLMVGSPVQSPLVWATLVVYIGFFGLQMAAQFNVRCPFLFLYYIFHYHFIISYSNRCTVEKKMHIIDDGITTVRLVIRPLVVC